MADLISPQDANPEDSENAKIPRFYVRYWQSFQKYCVSLLKQERFGFKIFQWIYLKFSDLTVSQWLYFIAAILLLTSSDEDIKADATLIWVGAIAGAGLMRELWHVFNRIWEHMLGKGLVLVLYAATANLALAIAALKINDITGIEPTPFIFAIGFTTLIMLPFWFLVSSIVFFSLALIASNLWLILSVFLRLIRIKVQVHWEDRSFVLVTMLLRVILIPYVILSIFFVAVPFAKQIEIFDNPLSQVKQVLNEREKLEGPSSEAAEINAALTFNGVDVSEAENAEENSLFEHLIVNFIYYFETYPNSACKKTALQRSLMIDENLVLLVEKDDSELGYHFFVAPCEGNFTEPNPQ